MKILKNHLKKYASGYIFSPIVKLMIDTWLFFRFKLDSYNASKYLRKMGFEVNLSKVPFSSTITISLPSEEYFIYNPTLISLNDELLFFARMTNLTLKPNTSFWEKDLNTKRYTSLINGVCSFSINESFEMENFKVLIQPVTTPNFEDPKVFVVNGKILLFGNLVKNSPPKDKALECNVAFLDVTSKQISSLSSPLNRKIEKNWIPIFSNGNKVSMIYESKPLRTVEVDVSNSEIILQTKNSRAVFNYHGGSQAVRIANNRYLRIVRHKLRRPRLGLVPYAYAIVHDQDLEILFESKPFIFRKLGIEICNGLTLKNDTLFFSWGEDDERMYLGKIELQNFLNWVGYEAN